MDFLGQSAFLDDLLRDCVTNLCTEVHEHMQLWQKIHKNAGKLLFFNNLHKYMRCDR